MAAYGMSSYYGGYGGGSQSYAQPSYNSYGSNNDAGRRRSLGYDQNPSYAFRRRSSSLDYEPGGGGRYSRKQSVADPYADDDDRMSRQRLMEDLDYQIQEKKRLEQMRREKESYEERILDQNVAKQRKQMQEEYQREQNLKRMKEEQRRKKQAAHEAYLASLEQQYRRTSVHRQPSPPDSPEAPPSRRTELRVDPNSEYSAYDSTPVKGKGAYDIGATEKIGPKSKPPISKGKKAPTSRPSNARSSPTSSSPTSRNTSSESPKAPRSKPVTKKSSSPERAKLTPPKEKPLALERKSNDNNNNLAPSKMDMSMTISDVPKRRKLPSSDDRYDFGLNLNQASRNTLQAQKDGNPFFDSKPGRRRKTPDPRVSKTDEKPAPPSPQPRSLPNYLQPTPPPSNPRTPSPRISMDSEVQTSDPPEERPERGRSEARSSGVQTQPLRVENGAQTYDDFEPERPPTPKLRPKPFDWRIKLDETTGDWRQRHEQDSKKNITSFEEQHKDLASQLKAMKRGLKGEDTDYGDHTRSRSSDHKGAEGSGEEAGRRRPASSDGNKGRSDGPQKRSDSRNNRGDFSDDLIDLENTDRTVLGAYLNKTGSRSGQKSGPGEDGRRSGGYTPSTGDKTRIGTPETDRDSGEGRSDTGEKRTNSGNWDETPNFLRRKEPFDLEATDRTLLTNYVDRNRRQ